MNFQHVMQFRDVMHSSLESKYAEWLELKQLGIAFAAYEQSTTGTYNTASLFAGSLRQAVDKAIRDVTDKMGLSQKPKEDTRSVIGEGDSTTRESEITDQTRGLVGAPSTPGTREMNPFFLQPNAAKGMRSVRSTFPSFF